MKIIYFGTPEFAVKPLEILSKQEDIEILSVITQPDKPVGRKQILTPPPVKTTALELGLEVLQPNSKKELKEILQKYKNVDFFVVIAYGMILTKEALAMPKFGAINVHPSLLPKYRGASPIQEALLQGDQITGVSIMKMDDQMDHGPVYLVKKFPISPLDTYETLSKQLSAFSSDLLPQVLKDTYNNEFSPIRQPHDQATYCQKISKEEGKIDFTILAAREILNRLRAYTPWPGIYTILDGKKLSILEGEISEENNTPGKFIFDKKTLKIGTKSGTFIAKKVQPEGKNPMLIQDFLNGYNPR